MTRSIATLSVLTLLSVTVGGQSPPKGQWAYPQARVNVRVVDESGNPVPNVNIGVGFCTTSNHSEIVRVEGRTDANGLFAGQGFSYGDLGARLTKNGYYLGFGNFPQFRNSEDGRWQPWDATYTSVLRKIENPAPTHAKWAWITAPEIGKPCGYDLMEGDWVVPWGKGKVADFLFTMKNTYSNYLNYDVSMNLAFSAPLDGVLKTELPKEYTQSLFIWPRFAPESGYQPTWRQEFALPGKTYRIQDIEKQKFFFRVRSVEMNGKIVSALYGKLSEGFQIGAASPTNGLIRICYYLNPTPLDRNMEFDLKRNLIKNAKPDERPRRP